MNNPAKRKVAKEFLAMAKMSLVCLQETTLDVIDPFILMQCLGQAFNGYYYLPAVETRGESSLPGTPPLLM